MGQVTAVVSRELLDQLRERDDISFVYENRWGVGLSFIRVNHPDAPDGRHVDVILDEKGLRFKPDQDV